MMRSLAFCGALLLLGQERRVAGFQLVVPSQARSTSKPTAESALTTCPAVADSRRAFLLSSSATVAAAAGWASPGVGGGVAPANAVGIGPVKIALTPKKYQARPCPPSKPMPGQKAMAGMRALCVTVDADMSESAPKDLEKAGVYGFITDGDTGDSVLANNPDLSTDAGQFTIIDKVSASNKNIQFEFVAAIPMEKDVSQFSDGIGPLKFEGIRIVSYPGGQQYGAISPCEMNEFSEECEAWEAENGP